MMPPTFNWSNSFCGGLARAAAVTMILSNGACSILLIFGQPSIPSAAMAVTLLIFSSWKRFSASSSNGLCRSME